MAKIEEITETKENDTSVDKPGIYLVSLFLRCSCSFVKVLRNNGFRCSR